MAKKKLFRSVLTIEILSEEELPESMSVEDVKYEISEGHCSGLINWKQQNHVVSGHAAVKQIEKHGTDLGFFQIDADGYELEEEIED